MKKSVKFLLCALTCLALGVLPVLGGCATKRSANELEIRYYNGGFGSEWIEYAAGRFEKENEGIKVNLIADPELQSSIGTYLESGKRLSDLYFTQSISLIAEWWSRSTIYTRPKLKSSTALR